MVMGGASVAHCRQSSGVGCWCWVLVGGGGSRRIWYFLRIALNEVRAVEGLGDPILGHLLRALSSTLQNLIARAELGCLGC